MADSASFQDNLPDPQNQIRERAGVPAADSSGLFKDIEAAGTDVGDVFSSLKVNQANAVKSATSQAYANIAYDSMNPGVQNSDPAFQAASQQIQDHPSLQTLQSTATSVQQGNQSPMALAIQKASVTKELNQQFPGMADVVDAQTRKVTGTTAYQDYAKQVMAPSILAQQQQEQLVKSAIDKGAVVIGKDGTVDTQGSIQALSLQNAAEQKAKNIQQNYENGVHTQAMYNTQMGEQVSNNMQDSLARTFQNAINTNEFQQIQALPAGQRSIALSNWYDNFSSKFQASTDEQISRFGIVTAQGPNQGGSAGYDVGRTQPGLTLETQKALQDQRKVMLESYKGIIQGGITPMKAVADLAEMAKNNGQLDAWRTHPDILQTVDNLGGLASPIIQGNASGISPVGTNLLTQLSSAVGTNNSGFGPTKTKYTPPSEQWLNNLQFTNQATRNPNTLTAAVMTGDNTKVPVAVNTHRVLATNINSLDAKQDLSFNSVQQNLTGLALNGGLNTADLRNNIKEIVQPVNINALVQSKAKQLNPDVVQKSIEQTVQVLNKGFISIPQALRGNPIDNKLVAIDPNTGYLQVDKSQIGTQTELNARVGTAPSISETNKSQNLIANVNLYNRSMDAYIKLKSDTPYKSVSDTKVRELLNRKYLPELMPDEENLGGGSDTPKPASSSKSGGLTVNVTPPSNPDLVDPDGVPASGGE